MNLESPKVTVEKSAEYLFNALTDVKSFEKLIDIMYINDKRPRNLFKYEKNTDTGIRYNDPIIKFRWPLKPKVISDRDLGFKDFVCK